MKIFCDINSFGKKCLELSVGNLKQWNKFKIISSTVCNFVSPSLSEDAISSVGLLICSRPSSSRDSKLDCLLQRKEQTIQETKGCTITTTKLILAKMMTVSVEEKNVIKPEIKATKEVISHSEVKPSH